MTRLLCTLLFCLLSWQANALGLSAKVDRTQLNLGETLALTLETADATLFNKPDLEPLEELFEVMGVRQLNSLITLSTGRSQAVSRWVITLLPKRSGQILIQPLRLGSLQSNPIALHILPAQAKRPGLSSSSSTDARAPLYIEASLDQSSVYVQAQAIFTLRLYHSVALYDDSRLSSLQIAGARIERLGKSRIYEKIIDGVRHGVVELRYAIYPQHSGELQIPSQIFTTTLAAPSNNSVTPYGPRSGKLTRVQTPTLRLTVKPKPANYPPGVPWLPARTLTLAQTWSPEPDHAKLGDSLTRTITLTANGLSSAQLAPLPVTEVAGLKRYPDQPQQTNRVTEQGLIGSRQERQALVPNQLGELLVPPLQVTWWNTQSDQLERSTLPARSLHISANPQLQQTQAPLATPSAAQRSGPRLWPWQLACAALSLSTALGFALWWRARRQPAIARQAQARPSPRSLLDELKRACQGGDAQAARQALDAWARQQPETLAELANRSQPLSLALDELNGALYRENSQHWQGEPLWQAVQALHQQRQAEPPAATEVTLAPLYPH